MTARKAERADHTVPSRDPDGTNYSLTGRRENVLRLDTLPAGAEQRAVMYVRQRCPSDADTILAALGLEP